MTEARFLQIHTLHSYSSVLLNRDDSGLAKRLPYGGVTRTRISSQCLKRHWRLADDPHALSRIAGFVDSKRSRELVTRQVLEPLAAEFAPATMTALNELFQVTVYGENGTKLDGRQTLLFGNPELNWLATQARELAPRIQQAIAETGDAPIAALPAATKGRRKAGDASKGANKAVEAVT
jgi:CRISPR system Cascade subunit CasC